MLFNSKSPFTEVPVLASFATVPVYENSVSPNFWIELRLNSENVPLRAPCAAKILRLNKPASPVSIFIVAAKAGKLALVIL